MFAWKPTFVRCARGVPVPVPVWLKRFAALKFALNQPCRLPTFIFLWPIRSCGPTFVQYISIYKKVNYAMTQTRTQPNKNRTGNYFISDIISISDNYNLFCFRCCLFCVWVSECVLFVLLILIAGSLFNHARYNKWFYFSCSSFVPISICNVHFLRLFFSLAVKWFLAF